MNAEIVVGVEGTTTGVADARALPRRGNVKRVVLGSTADAPCPVLVVPRTADAATSQASSETSAVTA